MVRAARIALEQAAKQWEQARHRLAELEHSLAQARAAFAATPVRRLPSAELRLQAAALSTWAERVRQGGAAVENLAAEVTLRAQQHEKARADWLACVARLQAAELHDARERREQRRLRSQRERAYDDEARDRFASATRVK